MSLKSTGMDLMRSYKVPNKTYHGCDSAVLASFPWPFPSFLRHVFSICDKFYLLIYMRQNVPVFVHFYSTDEEVKLVIEKFSCTMWDDQFDEVRHRALECSDLQTTYKQDSCS
jgi:hypothetical protein